MDPDANFRERIALARAALAANKWSRTDRERFDELTEAYAEWRANGGFLADYHTRQVLLSLNELTRKMDVS